MARRTDFWYLRRPTIGMCSYRRYREGPGIERPVARAVIAAVLGLFVLAFGLTRFFASAGPSQEALQLAQVNPLTLFEDPNPHFLGTPVAAIPAKKADLPPPAPGQTTQPFDGGPGDVVKVVDPGGVGVLLRSAP